MFSPYQVNPDVMKISNDKTNKYKNNIQIAQIKKKYFIRFDEIQEEYQKFLDEIKTTDPNLSDISNIIKQQNILIKKLSLDLEYSIISSKTKTELEQELDEEVEKLDRLIEFSKGKGPIRMFGHGKRTKRKSNRKTKRKRKTRKYT